MDNIVKFDKPYKFEGKEYDSLDLSGMEKMTVQDLIDIQKNIGNELAAMSVMEMTTSFAQEMAVKATGKPVEFFKLMPRGKIKKVQAAVIKGIPQGIWGRCKRRTGQSSYSGAGQLWRGCHHQGHHDPRRRLELAAGI